MKTRNILNLFTLFGASLFIFGGVNSASVTVPKCTYNEETKLYTNDTNDNPDYCIYNNKLYTKESESFKLMENYEGLIFANSNSYTSIDESSNSLILSVSDKGSVNVIESTEKGYYLDYNNDIISCTDKNKCKKMTVTQQDTYLVQTSISVNANGKGLILGNTDGTGEIFSDVKEGYYVNGATNQLILYKGSEYKEVSAAADSVYLNAADDGSNPLIKCSKGDGDETVKCVKFPGTDGSHYINSSEIDKSTKPLISCTSSKCETKEVTSNVYYENALGDNSKVLYCTPSKCTLQDGADGDVYVAKKDGDSETDTIIKCTKSGDKVECSIPKGTIPENVGYYLNSGSDASTNQVIICNNGCASKKVNPGYYKNAKGGFLECVNECKAISDEKIDNCKTLAETKDSTACKADSLLQFYDKSGNGTIHTSEDNLSSDKYVYATISKFPSISSGSGITTLFRITKYGIERFIASGVVGVAPSTYQLVTDINGGVIGTDVDLYDCSNTSSSKLCVKRSACNSGSYMYDSENGKALNCDSDGKLVDVSSDGGYYVDTTTTVSGRNPYIIYCNSSKEEKPCEHILPTVASYYINSGSDKDSKALIYCNGSSCYTTAASTGNYIANQQAGIIICSSQTSCEYKEAASAGNNANYVNAGINKASYALISCNKKACNPKAAKAGYYFSNTVTSLINCESNNVCNVITPTVNYYYYADTSDNGRNYIINCSKIATSIVCAKEDADTGSYLTNQSNVLITCSAGGSCKQEVAKPGYYQSAVKITINSSRDLSSVGAESELVSEMAARDSTTTYNIIECTTTNCELLSAEELANIPVCEYSADKCYITIAYALGKSTVNSISAGGLCTNSDRSVFYFATDTIVVAPSVIAGTTSTYVYTTTTTNCIIVGKKYADLYYTVGSDIYRLNDGSISHFFDSGYYFINVDKNVLVNGNNIDSYNDENVKLYQCNGSACRILDNPENNTYYADVNKRILKFNVNSDSYSFAYDNDIICIFANNKCTPNADLKGREFCITYKGEIVLAASDIKNRETGECYKAATIGNYIYGFNQYLYKMNLYSATVVDENGYDIVSLSTNNTISSKDYKNRLVSGNAIKIYGCHSSACKVYDPEEGVYYYDDDAKVIVKKEDNSWVAPTTSGYALVSTNPNEKYIYKFKTDLDEVTLLSKAASGYYYTVDNEMYECNENDNECLPITETDYYFTNTGEIYYCVYDSENLEKTECTKQSCYVGQNYYISENYYKCEAGSYLTPIKSRSCKYDENVIVNFPTILKEEFPTNIKQAIENIEKNNNSTAVAARSNKKYLSVVPAIFTNCTYNVEETEASYDFVCINNYVAVNEEDDSLEICSIENLGFVECVDDESNPEKCTPSSAFTRVVFNFFTVAFTVFASLYLMLF
jgi:hypothetical protein